MADTFNAGKFGAVVGIPFLVANATASQTNVDLTQGAGGSLATMPAPGNILGISVGASANVTAGSLTFSAHRASTELTETEAPTVKLDATNSNANSATVRPGAIRFAKNARIGVSYTSDATLAPTNTDDFDAILWVQLDANP